MKKEHIDRCDMKWKHYNTNFQTSSLTTKKQYEVLAKLAKKMLTESVDTDPEIAKAMNEKIWEIM
jgi:hypothetical protein